MYPSSVRQWKLVVKTQFLAGAQLGPVHTVRKIVSVRACPSFILTSWQLVRWKAGGTEFRLK